ncbi:unnamed protein product [Psylliodes chrysocephalus]|uniref:Uncharacterized protein n=1 Tax=Psylliodes chrysocephalus TaxID=3402493 RepID=A0A9P0GDV5_9CUCU|nr:unnamed protein product [Psylliodes chrysocephala]
MNSLYLLCLIGLASSVFSFPTKEKSYNFDNHNVSLIIDTEWVSQLDITEVSKVNDPNAKLILYNNVTQNFLFFGSKPRNLHLEAVDYADVYSKKKDYFPNVVTDSFTIEDGSVEVAMKLGSYGEMLRNINFTDLKKVSYIGYNVTYITEVNITYPYEKSIEEIHQQYPELINIQMPLLGNAFSGQIPLVNGTGYDRTTCKYRICTTDTKPIIKMDTYSLFDNVTVNNILEATVSTMGYIYNNVNGKNYFQNFIYIDVSHNVVIGEQ